MSTALPSPSLSTHVEPPIPPPVAGGNERTQSKRPWPRFDLEEPEDAAWICRSID